MLKITFYHQGISCDGNSPWVKPLGGTESAMILMARSLAARGHAVRVFCTTENPGTYDGVLYSHWKDFEAHASAHSLEVLIIIRSLALTMARRWAKVQIYFSPDAIDQPFVNGALKINLTIEGNEAELGLFSLKQVHPYADAFFFVSQWQAQTFISRFKIPVEKCHVVYNGVHLEDFPPSAGNRQRQIIYASTPFRGLNYLLEYFPEIKKRVPDATCLVVSGMQIYGMADHEDQRQYEAIYRLVSQPGVTLHKPLPKRELAVLLSQSRVMAYPNTFAETFCMAVLEGQAAGLPTVTTKLGGLCERLEEGVNGFLIPGHPSQPEYREAFIEKVVALLTDDDLWRRQSAAAYETAKDYAYGNLARLWEELFLNLLNKPSAAREPFLPKAQVCDILLNGYPRRLEIRQELILNAYCQMLEANALPILAGQLRHLHVASQHSSP